MITAGVIATVAPSPQVNDAIPKISALLSFAFVRSFDAVVRERVTHRSGIIQPVIHYPPNPKWLRSRRGTANEPFAN